MGWQGSCQAEKQRMAIGEWRMTNENGFDHPPEVGGYKIKAG